MATVDDDDVLDDEQLDVLLKFPPDIQEVIDQVLTLHIPFQAYFLYENIPVFIPEKFCKS